MQYVFEVSAGIGGFFIAKCTKKKCFDNVQCQAGLSKNLRRRTFLACRRNTCFSTASDANVSRGTFLMSRRHGRKRDATCLPRWNGGFPHAPAGGGTGKIFSPGRLTFLPGACTIWLIVCRHLKAELARLAA